MRAIETGKSAGGKKKKKTETPSPESLEGGGARAMWLCSPPGHLVSKPVFQPALVVPTPRDALARSLLPRHRLRRRTATHADLVRRALFYCCVWCQKLKLTPPSLLCCLLTGRQTKARHHLSGEVFLWSYGA